MTQTSPRLYIESPLAAGLAVPANEREAHYLANVLRLNEGSEVRLFNGVSGEWRALLQGKKKKISFLVQSQTRAQIQGDDVFYLFAPLKHARLDYMAQKATEMGASCLIPVLTQNTQVTRVNIERLRMNAIEAAEQCNLLSVPGVEEPRKLDTCLAGWPQDRMLIFCDEAADEKSPLEKLAALKNRPCAVLIGPEGGFTQKERNELMQLPFTLPISLGPRVLRADTAAVAALALLWQARA